MNYSKIGTLEAIGIVFIVLCNHLVLNMPQSIISSTGSASILNIAYVFLLALLFILLVIKLFKNFSTYDIIDVSEFLGGKFLNVLISIIILLYFILTSSTLIRNFSEGLKIIYFTNYPIYAILLFFIVSATICNYFGSKTVIRANLLIIPIIFISLLLVFIASFNNIIPQRALPILGYGSYETFIQGISNIFSFNGLFYLFFILPMLDKKENFSKISLISIIIIGAIILICITCLLLAFPFITSFKELSPLYLTIRYTHFGDFFQRPESLFILTWIISMISYISVSLMFSIKIFKKLTNIEHEKYMILPFSAILFIFSLAPKGMAEISFLENTVYKWLTIFITFVLFLFILIFANIKYRRKKSKEAQT